MRRVSARARSASRCARRRARSRVQFRRAQLLMPTFVLPLVLLAVIASGTTRGARPAAVPRRRLLPRLRRAAARSMQGALLAGLTAGIALAADIEFGFFDRLLTAPVHRTSIVLGRASRRAVLARRCRRSVPERRVGVRRALPGRRAGRARRDLLAALTAAAMGGIACGDRAAHRLAVAAAEPVPVHVRAAVHGAGVLPARAADAGAAGHRAPTTRSTYVVKGIRALLRTTPTLGDPWAGLARGRAGWPWRRPRSPTFAAAKAARNDATPTSARSLALWRRSLQRDPARARRAAAGDDRAGRSSCSA